MDLPEQEYPVLHPEYSPGLTFLYQNLPFISIFVGCPLNLFALKTLQNAHNLPIRGLAMLWCSCNFLSILVVESLFVYESHASEWNLGGLACKLYKSFAMLPVCVNPWFGVVAAVGFSRLLPLRGALAWLTVALVVSPLVYMFHVYGHSEDVATLGDLTVNVSSCAHAATRDEFYWTNVVSFVLYFNTPLVVTFCFLLFSHHLQNQKTDEWRAAFNIIRNLFLVQLLCWLPHWVDLLYLTKANDAFSDTTLAFLVVELLVFVHIGVLVPLLLRRLALASADHAILLAPLDATPLGSSLHEDDLQQPKDWP